jgi:hypothetical protein
MILPLHCILASRLHFVSIICLLRSCCHQAPKGGDCKENRSLAHLFWILVFDDQHDHLD